MAQMTALSKPLPDSAPPEFRDGTAATRMATAGSGWIGGARRGKPHEEEPG
jgi:hypothetical protein